jgi:integrase
MPRQRKSRPGRKPQLPDNIVRKEGKRNLYGRIQIGKLRKRFSLGTPDVDEAKKVLQKKIDEAWDDYLDERGRVTFSQQFTKVYPRRWAGLKTAKWHQEMHHAVVATRGDFYLDEVSEDWCWGYIDERRTAGSRSNLVNAKQVSDGTINKELAFVKRVMLTVDEARVKMPPKKQIDQKGAPTYPIVKIKRKKSEETVTNPLRDEAEAMELMNAMVPHARPIVLTLLMTGLRKENVLTLDIKQNLRWNERQIIVRQKGDTDHVIGMSDDLYYLLREVCGERTRGPVFVFGINGCDCFNCNPINKKTGKPNKLHKTGRIKSIRRTFDTARKQIGRPELRIHDLRHTFGTWLNRRGTDINKIKEAMGHSDIVSTQRYLHVGVDEVREELNKNIRFNIAAPRE